MNSFALLTDTFCDYANSSGSLCFAFGLRLKSLMLMRLERKLMRRTHESHHHRSDRFTLCGYRLNMSEDNFVRMELRDDGKSQFAVNKCQRQWRLAPYGWRLVIGFSSIVQHAYWAIAYWIISMSLTMQKKYENRCRCPNTKLSHHQQQQFAVVKSSSWKAIKKWLKMMSDYDEGLRMRQQKLVANALPIAMTTTLINKNKRG